MDLLKRLNRLLTIRTPIRPKRIHMSKRWKVRKQNAAKLEHSREVIDQFYGDVISELERLKAMAPEEREQPLTTFPDSATGEKITD